MHPQNLSDCYGGIVSIARGYLSTSITTKSAGRSGRRRRTPYGWLGAGASTLGVGVALAGAGTAHADDAGPADSGEFGGGVLRSGQEPWR